MALNGWRGPLGAVWLGLVLSFAPPARAQALTPGQDAAITRLLMAQRAATDVPGVALIVRRQGTIVYRRALGIDGNHRPFTAATPVWLGSLSKSFTALAVSQLAVAGRLRLDDPVARYLGDFRMRDPRGAKITVRNLVEHASGLTDRNLPDWTKPWPRNFAEATRRVGKVSSLTSEPGQQTAYHNANYFILGDLIEQVSGESYAAYMKRHIFTPLGMRRSRAESLLNGAPDVPPGYIFAFGHPFAMRAPGLFVGGAGGVIASAADLSRWAEAFARAARTGDGRGVIPPFQIDEMLHPASTAVYLYRFGWVVRQPGTGLIHHNGGLPTFVSHAAFAPDGSLSIAVVVNASLANPAWSEVGEDITDGVVAILDGRQPTPAPARQIGVLVDLGFLAVTGLVLAAGLWRSRPRRWHQRRAAVRGKSGGRLWIRAALAPVAAILLILVALPTAFAFVESWSWYWLWYLAPVVTGCLWLLVAGAAIALLLRFRGLSVAVEGR